MLIIGLERNERSLVGYLTFNKRLNSLNRIWTFAICLITLFNKSSVEVLSNTKLRSKQTINIENKPIIYFIQR